MRKIILCIVVLFSFISINAQEYTISGKVIIYDKNGFKNGQNCIVNISYDSQNQKSIADKNGNYSFKVHPGTFKVSFTYYGLITRNYVVKVEDKNVILTPSIYTDGSDLKEQALRDIEQGNPYLFVIGGYAPKEYKNDKIFMEKYKTHYYYIGCTIPSEYENLKYYNQVVLNWLSKNNGNEWAKYIRPDVEGYNKY